MGSSVRHSSAGHSSDHHAKGTFKGLGQRSGWSKSKSRDMGARTLVSRIAKETKSRFGFLIERRASEIIMLCNQKAVELEKKVYTWVLLAHIPFQPRWQRRAHVLMTCLLFLSLSHTLFACPEPSILVLPSFPA